jgi:predicted PurR-regulated permease PerM
MHVPSEQSAPPSAPAAPQPATTGLSFSLKTLAWIAVGVVLYLGKPAFAPILFAVLLAMLLSPLVDLLELQRVPRMLASILSVGALLAIIVVAIDTAWSPTLEWIDDAPAILQKVEQKVRPLRRIIARVESVSTRASSLTTTATNQNAAGSAAGATRMDALSTTRAILIDTAAVAILTVFFLAIGARTLRRIEAAFVNRGYRYQYMRVVEAVRHELSRYFATLTLINIGLGLTITGVVALWGLPSPWLWGMGVALLNFVPYIGPTISLFVLIVVSLVTFDGYSTAIGVAGSFLLITTIEGQFVQPLLIGYRLNLNPIMLFAGIWLGGWFWGISGVVLATPVLIALKEIANRQSGLSVMKALVSGQLTVASPVTSMQEVTTIAPDALADKKEIAPGDKPPTGATD